MTFFCSGCSKDRSFEKELALVVAVDRATELTHYCKDCRSPKASTPDVYFDTSKGSNQTDPNLCDRYTGPIPFSSKREKAAILKRLRLREDGDKVHGARNFDKTASKQWDNQ